MERATWINLLLDWWVYARLMALAALCLATASISRVVLPQVLPYPLLQVCLFFHPFIFFLLHSSSTTFLFEGWASFSLGTDTAGSGRVPAGFNNIVGLKPTKGRISLSGVVPACYSLDCVSIFALSCEVCPFFLKERIHLLVISANLYSCKNRTHSMY